MLGNRTFSGWWRRGPGRRRGVGRRSGWGGVAALLGGLLCVPLLWGDSVLPMDVPLLDSVAWLKSDARGDIARVNGESGQVDARLEVDGSDVTVHQADGVVVVEVDGELWSLDPARLDWSRKVVADGELVVGEGAAYLVRRDGIVRALDPKTLVPKAEVDLDTPLGPGVVLAGRLVVLDDEGRLHLVDGGTLRGSVAAGSGDDRLALSAVGPHAVLVNLTSGALRRYSVDGGGLGDLGQVTFPATEGKVLVPAKLPAGRMWMLATRSGELLSVDPVDGAHASVAVASPRSDVVGPVVARGRVYTVDRSAAQVVEVDAETMKVVHKEPLQVDDASKVELTAQGETVFVNDPASELALVIKGDDRKSVDKYDTRGEQPDTPDDTTAPTTTTTTPQPGGSTSTTQPQSSSTTHVPGSTPTTRPTSTTRPGSSTTEVPASTTTLPPTTTTTTAPQQPPGQVGGLSAVPGDATVQVTWTAPASSSPLTYTITVSPAVARQTTFTTAALGYSFTGLTNGVAYRFTVAPTNAAGNGPSAQVSATPVSPVTGPLITYILHRPSVSGSGYEVGFDYTTGSGTIIECSAWITGNPSSEQYGTCSGASAYVYIGDFFPGSGTSTTFTASIRTTAGTATRETDVLTVPAGQTTSSDVVIGPGDGTVVVPGVGTGQLQSVDPNAGGTVSDEPGMIEGSPPADDAAGLGGAGLVTSAWWVLRTFGRNPRRRRARTPER